MNKNNYNRTPYNYEQNDNYYEPDYSKMSIREELQTRYNELQKQKEKNNSFWNLTTNNYTNALKKMSIDNIFNDAQNIGYDLTTYFITGKPNKYEENKSSVGRALSESDRIKNLNISDINKHRYVSCIGAQDGIVSAGTTFAGGLLKEGNDLKNKIINAENNPHYKNKVGIILDSLKDIGNNGIGTISGYMSNDPDFCDYYIKPYTRK